MRRSLQQWYLAAILVLPLLLFALYILVCMPGTGSRSGEIEPVENADAPSDTRLASLSIEEESDFFTVNPSVAWLDTSGTDVDERLVPTYKKEVEDTAIVQLSHLLDRLEVGDTLILTVPQESQTYETRISEVKRSLGVTSYSGRVVEADIPLSFLITVGRNSVFANFSTPNASYELWGNRRYALLMDYAKIDQGVDYSKPDYYLPEESHEFE